MNESQISQVLETNMNKWMNESQIKVVRGKSSDFKISLPIMVPPIEQSDKKIQTFLEKSTQEEEEEEA